MRIHNIKIKDFRNIVRADINFGKINILTGKNSSGKSNFLLALGCSLSREKDYSDMFSNNVVTYHPGKKLTMIEATIVDVNRKVCFLLGDEGLFCVAADSYRLEKLINKSGLSKSHRLFFTGRTSGNKDNATFKVDDFWSDKALTNSHQDELVYEELFKTEIKEGATEMVQVSKAIPHQGEYLNIFKNLSLEVISWVGKTDKLHGFVTEQGTREIYDQVVERLKPRKRNEGYTPPQDFDRSRFIFLLADLQRNESYIENFRNDLKVYTGGIVTDISISNKGTNKGEIIIESPNGPRDIWTVSQGTSILLFFILILNWLKLPGQEKSYRSPSVMIFDEIDSLIHPMLMPQFMELLRVLSDKVQLFISSHSPYFIDGFEKNELYLLKDSSSLPGTTKLLANRCNIYDYEEIISSLPEEDKKLFAEMKNSQLFVEGFIDSIFPHKEYV